MPCFEIERNSDLGHVTPRTRDVQTYISQKKTCTDEILKELLEAHLQITNDEASKEELYPSFANKQT